MNVNGVLRNSLATIALIAMSGMVSFACVAGVESSDDGEEASLDGDEEVAEVQQAVCGVSSCGTWSSWYNYGSTYCSSPNCTLNAPARYQGQERFRWCWDANGNQCQELQHRSVKVGCCPY